MLRVLLFEWCARLFFNYYFYCECCVSPGGVRGYFNYCYYCEFRFSVGGVRGYFLLLLLLRVLCFGWRALIFLIITTIASFAFVRGGVHDYF